jgi:hypothetical protein
MAYLDQPPVDESQEQEPQAQPGAAGGTIGAGHTGATQQQRGSGTWTNLQSYLRSNQPQAQQMAGRIAGNVEQQRQQYGQEVQKQGQRYEDYLRGLERPEEERKEAVKRIAGWTIDQGGDPTAEAQQLVSGGIFSKRKDPESFESFDPSAQDILQKQKQMQETTNRLRDESGRIQALRELQDPQATRGEGLLNQLLLQGNPQAKNILQEQANIGTGGHLPEARERASQQMSETEQLLAGAPQSFAGNIWSETDRAKANLANQVWRDKIAAESKFEKENREWQNNYTDAYNRAYYNLEQIGWHGQDLIDKATESANAAAGSKPVMGKVESDPSYLARKNALEYLMNTYYQGV